MSTDITKKQKYYTLFLLVLVFTSSHIDRNIIAILLQPIKETFLVSDTQLGFLTGVTFALFYATLAMPMAMWADRHNRRNLIALSISLWSLMTAFCGLAFQYWQLILFRIGVGVGEAGSNPPSHSIISDLYSPEERGTAMAIFATGVNIGVMMGFLIGGWVNEWLNWRWAFVIAGVPGVLIAFLVRFTMKEPQRGFSEGLTKESLAPSFTSVVRYMFKNIIIRHFVIAHALFALFGYSAIAWTPVYFQRIHLFSSGEVGTFLALSIGLGGGVGTFLGGFIADKLAYRNEGWRAWIICFAVLIYIPTAILSFTALDSSSAMYWFLGPAILGSFHVGIIFAVLQSEAPVEMRSVVAAINLFVLNIIGMGLGPLMVGIVSDYMEPSVGIDSLRYGLLITTILPIWGAVHMWRGGVLLSSK